VPFSSLTCVAVSVSDADAEPLSVLVTLPVPLPVELKDGVCIEDAGEGGVARA